jgi:transcriptional regulator with XRE-family HTH domain
MRAGLSQRRLAELSGLSTSLISALECGDSGASPETAVRLAAALRCPVDDLYVRRSA